MPCIHIIHVALERGKKIPLFCFNKRFFCPKPLPLPEEVAEPLLLPEMPDQLQQVTEEAAAASASPAAELAQEESLGPQPARLAEVAHGTPIPLSTTQDIARGCENIIYSNMFAHNSDEESMNIFANLLITQVWVVEGLKPLTTHDIIIEMIARWQDEVKEKIKQLRANKEPAYGICDCATLPNTRETWKKVPQEVLTRAQKLLYHSLTPDDQ